MRRAGVAAERRGLHRRLAPVKALRFANAFVRHRDSRSAVLGAFGTRMFSCAGAGSFSRSPFGGDPFAWQANSGPGAEASDAGAAGADAEPPSGSCPTDRVGLPRTLSDTAARGTPPHLQVHWPPSVGAHRIDTAPRRHERAGEDPPECLVLGRTNRQHGPDAVSDWGAGVGVFASGRGVASSRRGGHGRACRMEKCGVHLRQD